MEIRSGFDHPDEPRLLFADHHDRIDAACEALRQGAYADDPTELIEHYRSLERAVLEHLEAEEDAILPAYAEYDPADAEAIRAAHDELRRQLYHLGVDVELHAVRARSLERLLTMLRDHAAREERTMYRWAQANLPAQTKRDLFKRISDSLRALTDRRTPE